MIGRRRIGWLRPFPNKNLTLVPLLDGNPDDAFAPVETAVFAQWAAEFAERYGDTIQFYIIWDEPNLASHWGNQPPNAADVRCAAQRAPPAPSAPPIATRRL
ncbi:MAG: hypothetical protein H6653_02215 [Ardenticatenaceae bacterium]|nr:hypothetical protein [Ardenticatenaceae bacterium]